MEGAPGNSWTYVSVPAGETWKFTTVGMGQTSPGTDSAGRRNDDLLVGMDSGSSKTAVTESNNMDTPPVGGFGSSSGGVRSFTVDGDKADLALYNKNSTNGTVIWSATRVD